MKGMHMLFEDKARDDQNGSAGSNDRKQQDSQTDSQGNDRW